MVEPPVEPKPNIVLIVADDMARPDLDYMPKASELLADEGMTFHRAYATTPSCAPARSSILTGKYAHNTGVLDNNTPHGGYQWFRSEGNEEACIPKWLKSVGYRTGIVGKYLNGYTEDVEAAPYWDLWAAKRGTENVADPILPEHLQVSALTNTAVGFIESEDEPFFLYFAPPPPHEGSAPSEAHRGDFAGVGAPRVASFNERHVQDKPKYINRRPRLDKKKVNKLDYEYRRRLRTLQDLDDSVERIVTSLQASGKLDNTYIIFTTDHGIHLGQHRLPMGKTLPYEEDIRVPLVIRGPSVAPGTSRDTLVANIDIAPTIAEIAGSETPDVDGRSLTPTFAEGGFDASGEAWRTAILIEQWRQKAGMPTRYRGVRTAKYLYVRYDTGEKEIYNMDEDPNQLRNLYRNGPLSSALSARVQALWDCSGESCRLAENL